MPDIWADWLLRTRFGGDEARRDRDLAMLRGVRDRVLAGAAVRDGDVVLDAGCGDGLIAFGALPLVGPGGRVIGADISADLLDHCREIAGDEDRISFVHTGFPDLAAVPDASADVVTIRSVLIYVEDMPASFAAIRRVLRPGGRLSLFEPINRYGSAAGPGSLWGFDLSGLEESVARVHEMYRTLSGGSRTMLAFDERDLVELAEAAGFDDIALDYRATVSYRQAPGDWDAIAAIAPNPLVPTLGEIVERALGPAERDELVARVRAELAAGRRESRMATAYVSAKVPA